VSEQEIKDRVTQFLAPLTGAGLVEDQNIFASGLVNSLFAMQLVLFVEKEFDLSVENDDLDLANFLSVNAITAFVRRKLVG
jgi:acyl carrier protein